MKKRKITSVFLALGLFASLLFQVPISAEEADQSAAVEALGTISTNSISGWPQASDISSEAAVVMENTTNTILYSKNADEVLFPGSTVKIMTCLLALENTQLTDEVTMTATGVSGVTDGGASISSQVDEVFTVEQCLYAIMVASANDIALQIAEHVGGSVDGWTQEQMKNFIDEHEINCPTCGKHNFTEIRQFNLMFKTFQGVTEDAKNTVYLRPETAQGIFVNFKNVQRTSRKKVPFGIGQIGKSFRNEITPGNFTFRTREFEQMELEFFCKPGTDLEWFTYWRQYCIDWLQKLGIKEDEMRARDHSPEELCFYSKGTTDIEFLFPFGWGELWGIADRTDYDLTQHQTVSGEDMSYFDDEAKEKYIPYVIEPSLGADRVTLAFLCSAYDEEELEGGDVRTVLHFHPALAPVKIGVLPLSKKLNEGAEKVFAELSKTYNCEFDDRGNIGKRYRRQDEIGTPFCITYDFDSEEDNAVTVRDRDTMEQERVKIADLKAYFADKFTF